MRPNARERLFLPTVDNKLITISAELSYTDYYIQSYMVRHITFINKHLSEMIKKKAGYITMAHAQYNALISRVQQQ